MANEEYKVAGYGERVPGDGPYHENADYDPKFVFAHAGDPKTQAKYQNDLIKLDEAVKAAVKKAEASAEKTVEKDKKEIKDA